MLRLCVCLGPGVVYKKKVHYPLVCYSPDVDFDKYSKRKGRSTCTSILWAYDYWGTRFTHAACEKAEKWINKIERKINKIRCRKHSLPIAFFVLCLSWDKACGTLSDLSHLRVLDRKIESRRSSSRPCSAALTHVHVLDHFSRLLFAPLSGLLQCQAPRHRRHPSSPLSTKLFRRLLKFQSFRRSRLLHCTHPPRASQNGKEERKVKLWSCQPCRFCFVLLHVTHNLLSVKVCLGLAISCVL